MAKWQQFFIFCSGIDTSILEKTPTDTNKYIGIGATVLFTGLLAFFSSSYALFTVFDTWILAIFFGLIWGLMIFNLDRYIVSSMKRQGSIFKDIFTATPRLAMAILLAVVISVPLELKIFDKEIQSEIVIMEQEIFKTQEDALYKRYADQKMELQESKKEMLEQLSKKTEQRDELLAIATAEADGTGGSFQKNLGPIYKLKKATADQAQAELDDYILSSAPQMEALEASIVAIDDQVQTELDGLNRSSLDGIAFRMEALKRLADQSNAIWFASLFITLLFIAIETSPLFVKLISSRSPYDYVLHEVEHKFQMNHAKEIGLLSNLTNNELALETEINTHKTASKIKAEKELIDIALTQRVEELKKIPVSWKKIFNKNGILDQGMTE